MSEKVNQLLKFREEILEAGGTAQVNRQHSRGKLTARERLNLLFDPGTFVEVDAYIRHHCMNFNMIKDRPLSDGVVTGYGKVNGRLVYAFAQDFTIFGGSLGEMHADKIVKIQKMALKMGAPIVGMNDSGGARIQEGVDALSGFGKIFFQNVKGSGVIPQISAIMGSCAGGAVYSPALMDFVFMVDKTSKMFITGPQVIKSVTGEEITSEELGGAYTHNNISGVAHYIANDDEDCIYKIQRLLSFLPNNNQEFPPIYSEVEDINEKIDALDHIIPANRNAAYNISEIISLLVDHEDFFEYQSEFAINIITGYGRINGQTVGIVANQPNYMAGCLDINASDKAARFIRTCDSFNIPLISLVDVPGFLPGSEQEYNGIIRHGAKMLYAYSEAIVPKITIILRKAYGGSYIAMCSKELGADMVFAWPTAEIAVMGSDGAANIIFRHEIAESDHPEETRKKKIKEYRQLFLRPYKAAERGYVDDIIIPSETKVRIADALDMLMSKRETNPPKKHGNVPL